MSRDKQTKNDTVGEPWGVIDDSACFQFSHDIAEYVQRTTKEQGVPEKVQDIAVIGKLALMTKQPTRSSRKLDQTAKIST